MNLLIYFSTCKSKDHLTEWPLCCDSLGLLSFITLPISGNRFPLKTINLLSCIPIVCTTPLTASDYLNFCLNSRLLMVFSHPLYDFTRLAPSCEKKVSYISTDWSKPVGLESEAVCKSTWDPILYPRWAESPPLCKTLLFLQEKVCLGFGVFDTSIVLVRFLFLNLAVSSWLTSTIFVLRYSVGSSAFMTNLGFSLRLASVLSSCTYLSPMAYARFFSRTWLEHSKPSLTGKYFFIRGVISCEKDFSFGDIRGGSERCCRS